MKKKKLPHPKPVQARRFLFTETLPVQITALVLLGCAAYWNSLGGGFHFDDQGIFLDSYVAGPGFGWEILRLVQTRPLTFLSFHWNFLVEGRAPFGYHLISVLLHAGNSVLVLLIARRVLRGAPPLLAAALFALHPLQTQAVNYVFERATLLAAFFALLSLLLFLREKYYGAAVAFIISLLAKEETIALPAFLLIHDLIHRRDRIRWSWYGLMLGAGALITARLFYVLHSMPEVGLGFGTRGVTPISYALTQCRVIWMYLRLVFIPLGLNLDHDVPLSQGLFSPPATFPALVGLVVLIGALVWLVWRRKEAALWALGFFVLLAPSSSVIPVSDVMFEHRVYFPLACLTISAALVTAQLQTPWRAPVLAVLLAALFAGTVIRNRVWRDDLSLWTDVVQKSPRKARGYFQLGQAYASKDAAGARQWYERGLDIEPENASGHTNLGLVVLSQGDPEAALTHLRRALDLNGEKSLVWNNIGVAQLRRGEIEEGINAFRRAIENNPCRFDARWNLTHTLAYEGRKESAIEASQVPPNCHLLPEQEERLMSERRSIENK